MESGVSLTSPLKFGTGSEKDVKSLLAMHLSSCCMFCLCLFHFSNDIPVFFLSYQVLMLEGAKSKFGVSALRLQK
jgi:hypothetical protein